VKVLLGATILLLSVFLLAHFALRPDCVPLTATDLAQFKVPIEQRTDRDLYLRVFQLRDGRWHQRKTWLSRQLYF
jgi:hypothetical protein